MAELIFEDKFSRKVLSKLIAKHKIDRIVTSGFIMRDPNYKGLKKALEKQAVPVTNMKRVMTLSNIDSALSDKKFHHILVVGGGRLVDYCKLLCSRRNRDLSVLLTNLSNDGFASGCSALPLKVGGDFETIKSRVPKNVFAFHDVLSLMPKAFLLSGLGECVSKLQVMEDLRFEHSQRMIDKLFCQPLESLFDLLFRDFTIHNFRDREFVFRLTQALYQYSNLMRDGSTLCSRSEHEFEKACTISGVELRHGTLVLIGALVSMHIRDSKPSLYEGRRPSFTYDTLLKVIVKFKLTKNTHKALEKLNKNLSNPVFSKNLLNLSNLRPDRIGLWNYVDSRKIKWLDLFNEIQQDLYEMKRSPKRELFDVLDM
ncbi:MAG: iron-containing alcohol dehydrogenase [Magnetococcales bacterium]|nr:iron-containing alcohol dehydrogenase [Magnetococcales bacterium]